MSHRSPKVWLTTTEALNILNDARKRYANVSRGKIRAKPDSADRAATWTTAQAGELPAVDFALPLLAAACGLPDEAPFVLFALGRGVGWLAHALEQVQANRPIRPRARYAGPALRRSLANELSG